MGRRNKVFTNVEIIDIADKGMAVGRKPDGEIVLVKDVVPGDVVDVLTLRKKKGLYQCVPQKIQSYSPDRIEPFCKHFGSCGGCKWQHLEYQAQLSYKYKQVHDALVRIAGIPEPHLEPILAATATRHFRNKLEFTFSDSRWLTQAEIDSNVEFEHRNALGFHAAGSFARVVDLDHCHLMAEPVNEIRNFIRTYALENGLEFQNIRQRTGLLRNVILRNTLSGAWMLILICARDDRNEIEILLEKLTKQYSEITSVFYGINTKANDSIYDIPLVHFSGVDHLEESLGEVKFRIGPKSFFQTNPRQAKQLYDIAKQYAALTENDILYDLYTGIGSIALYLAKDCKSVVGIEEVEPAIQDAKLNAQLNGITNAHFYAGRVRDILNESLLVKHGKPDVLITDPPRAGMHRDAIEFLLNLRPPKIVYVSCNPSTQARDIKMLAESYAFVQGRPVDMFPHTSHIENVVLLKLK